MLTTLTGGGGRTSDLPSIKAKETVPTKVRTKLAELYWTFVAVRLQLGGTIIGARVGEGEGEEALCDGEDMTETDGDGDG